MKKLRFSIALALIMLFTVVGTVTAQPKNFRARLSGGQEVDPVATKATGVAVFQLAADGNSMFYGLIVANIDDVFAAHIHCAPAGQNGSVGVGLFGGSTVTVNGLLASGTITAPSSGNACGWTTVADIAAAMASGDAYVNVHTAANPGGEIRGQVR